MPNTMIERMARALCEKQKTPPIYPQEIDADWPMFTDAARAVLAAMREPTEVMVQAQETYWEGEAYWDSAEKAHADCREDWARMIDAALAEA